MSMLRSNLKVVERKISNDAKAFVSDSNPTVVIVLRCDRCVKQY